LTRKASPTIALFPEASFGAALNCVAQALRSKGARPVFICHAGFSGVFADYGFQEHQLPSDEPLSDGERQSSWQAFVRRHLPHFRPGPVDQLETYVAPSWQAIIDTSINAEAPLRQRLARLKPAAAVPDNVYLDAWFSQPSVVAKSDLFIHHGRNNSFCKALRFGVPSLIMPYCWDGHDNARRAEETGTGDHIGRDGWTEGVLEKPFSACWPMTPCAPA
jgi:UDP:flavonoid glycosyltransferase YjiC (YdhE family)